MVEIKPLAIVTSTHASQFQLKGDEYISDLVKTDLDLNINLTYDKKK